MLLNETVKITEAMIFTFIHNSHKYTDEPGQQKGFYSYTQRSVFRCQQKKDEKLAEVYQWQGNKEKVVSVST